MLYVFNKNKIISYMVAFFIVISLFAFSSSAIPNKDIQLLKVSTNVTENKITNQTMNNN